MAQFMDHLGEYECLKNVYSDIIICNIVIIIFTKKVVGVDSIKVCWLVGLFFGLVQSAQPKGAILCLRLGAAAERSYPMYKERWLPGRKRTKRSYFMFKVRRGSREEIPLVQGKSNPSKTVGVMRGHQRAHTLKA